MLLEVPLVGPSDLGPLRLERPTYRVYCPPSQSWADANDTFSPMTGWTAHLAIPSAGIGVDVSAVVEAGDTSVLLTGDATGISIRNLAALADLTGPADLVRWLPPEVGAGLGALADLELLSVAVGLDLGDGRPTVSMASATVGFRDVRWPVLDDVVMVTGMAATFIVSSPFADPDVIVSGTVEIAGVPLRVSAASGDGFTVYAELAEEQTIPLRSLLGTYLPTCRRRAISSWRPLS